MTKTIKVGSRVRVRSTMNRRSRVVEVRLGVTGPTYYILADGGWFSLDELETE